MGKFNNTNNGKKNGGNRRNKEEYEARKAAQLEQQNKNLDVIADIAKYLNEWLISNYDRMYRMNENKSNRITMKDILTMLNDEKGYSVDETKAVSQYSYMLMELANARNNKYISGDRINIRIMYIEERLKTSFKRELHDRAIGIVDTYTELFYWDDQANAENYNVLGDNEENNKESNG